MAVRRVGELSGGAAQGDVALHRVTLGGSWTPLAPITSGYGVTQGADGMLYAVHLDAELNSAGDPYVFATLGGAQHDALAIDACDNLYIAEYADRSLKRVAPDGTVTVFYSDAGHQYGHGAEFGSGLGGWREDALYLAQPYDNNTVRELVIGVPSADTVRAWW